MTWPAQGQRVETAGPQEQQTWSDQQKQQSWAAAKLAASPRRHAWIAIRFGDRTLRAFITYPSVRRRAPVVIVTHEVFGLTDSTRNTADEIAALGYITIAPDMVSGMAPNGGGISGFPSSRMASSMITALPDIVVNGAFDAWAEYARALAGSNGKLAMLGLSWGGGASFRYAASPHTANR